MSSILKALRKAEEQSPKVELTSDLLRVDTKRAVSRRARGSRKYRLIGTSAVVIIILGLGTWFAFHYRELMPARVAADRPQAPRVDQNPATQSQQASAPQALQAPAPQPQQVPAPQAQPIRASAPPNTDKGVEAPPLPEGEKVVAWKPDPVPRPAPKEQSAPQPPARKAQESHPEDSKFKLEAIVWSDNAMSRFAVINGQILRKGGSIEGLSVTDIEKDFVAVRTGGRDWALKFTVD